MSATIAVSPRFRPPLDPGFLPASLWNRAYRAAVEQSGQGQSLAIALERSDHSVSVFRARVFPHAGEWAAANEVYVERLVKFLLWQRGGCKVTIAGDPRVAAFVRQVYAPEGRRAFDFHFMGERVYGVPMLIEATSLEKAPQERETAAALGRNLEGCRIGFDLGGSDRKYAALIDGEVVHSEEVVWDPYFKADPQYHFDEINDTLKRAASHLPRVDAIGGSAAGVYVNNEVRVASLFRGVPQELFNSRVRRLFYELQAAWNGVPFEVVNDGEVTALAGSMALNDNAVLGVSMGTSQAGGYVTPQGSITNWLNELAFVPIDYRADAPVDEWSGDGGVGAQYFSQQAVARLAPAAGLDFPRDMPLAERLAETQKLMARGDGRARGIYESIGTYFGYAIAHYADFYELRHLLVLGRVLSGEGGGVIVETAHKVLREEFPELAESILLHVPSEKEKRHGQAVAAASLPRITREAGG
ncbi:MAG: ROK family protein [Acidobacteria bacterium]|nr:ROK family protein [Acidobacteriota bacterium]